MKNHLGRPSFDIDDLLVELTLIRADEELNRIRKDNTPSPLSVHESYSPPMNTPPEAVNQRCAIPVRDYVDTWKMTWSNAIILKNLMPELSLYWTDELTTDVGRIVIADAYEALDCEELVYTINEINSQSWSGIRKYRYQDKPKRLRLTRNKIESFYKVPTKSSWFL